MKYTIGEFSKISHISPRMLRYYDNLGLIHPDFIGSENGYRYYNAKQLASIAEIRKYQNYGIHLKEIPHLLTLSDSDQKDYLIVQLNNLKQERDKIEQSIHLLELAINLKEDIMDQIKDVIIMQQPEQYVYSIRRTISINAEDIQKLIHDLYTEVNEKGLTRTGVAQLAYISEEFSQDNMEVEAQLPVKKGEQTNTIPSCTCISALHKGNHESINITYDLICKWLAKHKEYHTAGPVIERFISDDHSTGHFETGVLFPVVKC